MDTPINDGRGIFVPSIYVMVAELHRFHMCLQLTRSGVVLHTEKLRDN